MLCDWVSNYLKPSKNQKNCTLNLNFSAVFESWPMRSLVVTMKKVDVPSCIAVSTSFLCGSSLKSLYTSSYLRMLEVNLQQRWITTGRIRVSKNSVEEINFEHAGYCITSLRSICIGHIKKERVRVRPSLW